MRRPGASGRRPSGWQASRADRCLAEAVPAAPQSCSRSWSRRVDCWGDSGRRPRSASVEPIPGPLCARDARDGRRETVGFSGAPTGPAATAEFYRRASDRSYRPVWMVSLVNPVAPIDAFLTDRGYLATLDNWHNMGYGKVVAFYAPTGTLIRAYALAELFSAAEIDAMRKSVSSIWWRKPLAYVRPEGYTSRPSTSRSTRMAGARVRDRDRSLPILRAPRRGAPVPQHSKQARHWRGYVIPPRGREPGRQRRRPSGENSRAQSGEAVSPKHPHGQAATVQPATATHYRPP